MYPWYKVKKRAEEGKKVSMNQCINVSMYQLINESMNQCRNAGMRGLDMLGVEAPLDAG